MKKNNVSLFLNFNKIIWGIIFFIFFLLITKLIFIHETPHLFFPLFFLIIISMSVIFNINIALWTTIGSIFVGLFFLILNPIDLKTSFILGEIIFIVINFILLYQFFNQCVQKEREKIEKLVELEENYNVISLKYNESKSLTTFLEKRINKYELLNKIAKDIGGSLEIKTIISLLIENMKKIFEKDKILIWLIENEKKVFAGGNNITFAPVWTDFDQQVIESKMPLFIEKEIKKTGYLQLISVPLIQNKKIIGLIKVEDCSSDMFVQEDVRFLSIISDLLSIAIERSFLYTETEKLAITDGLTGLYLHRYFYERLKYDIDRANRYNNCLSLLMIDIDYFKKYNDVYGHQSGDIILKKIAYLLKSNVRNVDLVARYGGEEFVIIMPETTKEGAKILATRIKNQVENYQFILSSQITNLTISIGIASYPEDTKEQKELVANADLAMYKAKELGRNRVCVFEKI